MVRATARGHRGGSTLGCLVSLALFVAALYYGSRIGGVYLRYYEVLDAMRSQGRFAANLPDTAITRRLAERADSILPGKRPRFRVWRGGRPYRITIHTEYRERVQLPFFDYTFVLRPRAEERL